MREHTQETSPTPALTVRPSSPRAQPSRHTAGLTQERSLLPVTSVMRGSPRTTCCPITKGPTQVRLSLLTQIHCTFFLKLLGLAFPDLIRIFTLFLKSTQTSLNQSVLFGLPGEKPFMCESCGKSFASKEYLKHHSRIHMGFRPYKCELCGRAFAQRSSIHSELLLLTFNPCLTSVCSVSGERPYHCTDCDKQFTQLNALQRHQRIHTGEKPYMCGLCNRTFTDKSTVRRHTMVRYYTTATTLVSILKCV